jgi:hypothetical protein
MITLSPIFQSHTMWESCRGGVTPVESYSSAVTALSTRSATRQSAPVVIHSNHITFNDTKTPSARCLRGHG